MASRYVYANINRQAIHKTAIMTALSLRLILTLECFCQSDFLSLTIEIESHKDIVYFISKHLPILFTIHFSLFCAIFALFIVTICHSYAVNLININGLYFLLNIF